MNRPLHLTGARVWNGTTVSERNVFIDHHGRITNKRLPDALTVDLSGFTLFPGLINAHDHLELNHYPRTKFRDVYDNAHQWGEDVNARLDTEPFHTLRQYPLKDRLFIGGIKNLLCGATTVIHHGAKHKPMFKPNFPVRVLENYGWAHSLHFSTAEEIAASFRNTPDDHPWFIHLAEGTDAIAANEFQQLAALGCISTNQTVVIHGVRYPTDPDHTNAVRGIVWCPSTNRYLLGETLDPHLPSNALALGSDSRLTADGDILDELRFAFDYLENTDHAVNLLMRCLFIDAPFILSHRSETDWLRAQPTADLIAIPNSRNAARSLCQSTRADLALVIRDGIPRIGNPDLMAQFPYVDTIAATLDGINKQIHIQLAKQHHRSKLKETGLEVEALPWHKRIWFF